MEKMENSEKHRRPQTPKRPRIPTPSEPEITPLRREAPRREAPVHPPTKAKPVPDRPKWPWKK